MEPFYILQRQITMYYSKIKLGCKDAFLPKNFKISDGYSKNRYEKVVCSLTDFFEEQDVVAYRDLLVEDL